MTEREAASTNVKINRLMDTIAAQNSAWRKSYHRIVVQCDSADREIEEMREMIRRSGLDITACSVCGSAVLTTPEGLAPICEDCDAVEGEYD